MGARGCAPLRQIGGTVLAQDRESSVVYGMPGAVVDAGIADRVVPLDSVAKVLEDLVSDGATDGGLPRASEGGGR